jgi:type I restriction enzyme S subunit
MKSSLHEVHEFELGDVAFESKERAGAGGEIGLSVYGVDRANGLTPTAKYTSKDLGRYKILKPGMFAYNPMRLNIGSIAYCNSKSRTGLVSPDYVVFGCDQNKLDPNFFSYFIKGPLWKQWTTAAGVGSVRVRIYFRELSRMRISLPPLAEQKQIAEVLGALDAKIELNQRMNATLEATARALFQSWFVDFDPVRAKLDGRQPYGMGATTTALFPDSFEESSLGHIPSGWGVVDLPEAIDFLEGPGLRNWQYKDTGMKFLNIRCIGEGDLDIAKANCISTEEFEKTYRHFALREDDIVISTSGTLGRLAIVRPDHLPVMLNTSIIRMRGNGAVGLGYVWGFLQSEYFLSEMFALAAGSVQLNFGPMHLRQISILRPPDAILESFEQVVQPLLRKSLHLRKESRTLATLRDTLLPKLLSGELSLKEAA